MNVNKYSVIDSLTFKDFKDNVMIKNRSIDIYALNSFDAIERGCCVSNIDISKSIKIGEIII